ncbi:hypothetical protein [Pontibacillus salipaludis]|uniref:Uncharacterized protein n=1 Tax=Pontibacillus salipaludis TaxID=1697394 RepID=A0ABQ1Q199_9BACI|nr:hypothetical protein [Pontibacillus salipaludis]GGD09836.1 hypothetical protein GCM10011389_16680 [Pontibacillus salipaludis]
MVWLIIILSLLGFGALVDYIAKKRSLNVGADDGIKNASYSEQVYVESSLHQMKHGNDTDGPI